MNENSEYYVNPDDIPSVNDVRDAQGFDRREGWSDPAPEDSDDVDVVTDEVVGEIPDENGEVLEVHLVKPAAETSRKPFTAGKYGTYGVRTGDARVIYKGPEVETILQALGFKGDTFTEETREEVRQIQAENKLPATGRVDKRTWDVIVNS